MSEHTLQQVKKYLVANRTKAYRAMEVASDLNGDILDVKSALEHLVDCKVVKRIISKEKGETKVHYYYVGEEVQSEKAK